MNAIRQHVMEARCERAFERRFGKSVMPLRRSNPQPNVVRIRDTETGTWAEYDISAHRVRRVAEHDEA